MPLDTPQVRPVDEPTVATAASLLLQTPPLTALVRVIQEPTHIPEPPRIGPGPGVTVSVRVTEQPVPIEYVTVTVPVVIAVTTPEVEPIAATDGLLLLQFPPADELLNVVVAPTQRLVAPVIGPGGGLTVTVIVI